MSMFRGPDGKVSMMRVVAAMAAALGFIMGICGCIAMFMDKDAAEIAMITGMGCFTAGGLSKAMQTKWENKRETI